MTKKNDMLVFRAADLVVRAILRLMPPTDTAIHLALSWGYRFDPKPHTFRLRSGLLFRYPKTDFIPLLLSYVGTFEPGVIKLLRQLLKRGDTVLDVGANIGFHTLECWNAVGRDGRVISIEAMPQHASSVRENLSLNQFPTADVLNVAVGDRDGEISLGLPEGGNQGMYGINAGQPLATVALRRIDDLLPDLPSLALLKMDIEGAELMALKGAEATLRRHRPAIVIELNEKALQRCGASSKDVVSFLEDLGYRGQTITADGLRPLNDIHDCDECLFLPQGAAAAGN